MRYFVVILVALIAGLVGGFFGGVAAVRYGMPPAETYGGEKPFAAQTITSRRFVLVDQAGTTHAILTVLPARGAEPTCTFCDGRAHLIATDQQQGTQLMWPPAGPQLSPADLLKLLMLLK